MIVSVYDNADDKTNATSDDGMQLPLIVEERLTTFVLLDAKGRVIASARFRNWFGVPTQEQEAFVRANFEKLAAAANMSYR